MLVFPYWRVPAAPFSEACRAQPWAPPPSSDYFASQIARPYVVPQTLVPKSSEDEWSGASSPEHASSEGSPGDVEIPCDWLGCSAMCAGVEKLSAHVAHAHAHPSHGGLYYCAWRDCCRATRGFNARYKMLVHVRTHTNERPHKCLQCTKSFSRAENLKIHIRSHSGEKPYICPYEGCGKAYSNSSDRFKHTRTHKVDKPYRCKVPGCDKRYTDPSSLRKHVKTNKHYPSKDTPNQHYSDESQSPQRSPIDDPTRRHDTPIASATYLSSQATTFNTKSQYNEIIVPDRVAERIPAVIPCRPKPVYPIRQAMFQVPILHYNNPIGSYSVLQQRNELESMEIENSLPLNLKCSKRIDYRPLEILRTDLPLDLSTKS